MQNQITYGSVYQTIGDVPDEGVAYILPLEDVKDETYVWITPECEVEVPGMPLYRFACDRSQLTGDFGFKLSASFSASGVIAISACSDWTEYAKRREEGGWEQEKAAILGASASGSGSSSGANENQPATNTPSSTSSTPTPTATTAPSTAAPSPLSAYDYCSSLSGTTCYLAFNTAGTWLQSNPAWIVTGFSGGKMKLTAVEANTDAFPSNAFPFRVTSDPATPNDGPAAFAIQNAETGEYLSWTSADGFAWAEAQGADTQFSTNDFYSGNGFEMNISYNASTLTAAGQANGDPTNQGWTYWVAKTSSEA